MAEVARQAAVYEKEITRNLGLYETIAENIINGFLQNKNNIGDTKNYHIANVVFLFYHLPKAFWKADVINGLCRFK